jgi:integrase
VKFLSQLHGKEFATYRDERIAEGAAASTVRSELMLISALYKIARKEWGMAGLRNPIADVAVPNPGRSNERDRRLAGDEQERLLAQLKALGPYFAPMAELAIETAMRQGELLALSWADVDLEKRVAKLRDTKNSEARDVPLSSRAVEIIRALPRALSDAAPLFPVTQGNVIRTFREACTAAGIQNLKFHDLRHEAVSRICERLPMHEAMRVSGHKTAAMLMRYYHPKAEDLARKLA